MATYQASQRITTLAGFSMERDANPFSVWAPMQLIPTAARPGVRYKNRGQYSGSSETWVAGSTPITPSPTGHTTTEVGHTKTVG